MTNARLFNLSKFLNCFPAKCFKADRRAWKQLLCGFASNQWSGSDLGRSGRTAVLAVTLQLLEVHLTCIAYEAGPTGFGFKRLLGLAGGQVTVAIQAAFIVQ